MKPAAILLSLFFSVSCAVAEAGQGMHLFILSGQSNMERLNPAISFTPAVEAAFGKEKVVVVKAAWGGQPISRWYKQWQPAEGEPPAKRGDLYDKLMQAVNTAMAGRKAETVTFVWMQGERDALRRHANVYEASLNGLLAQLAADLGRDDLNIVIGRLSDSSSYKDWRLVREVQMKIAGAHPRGAWVDTDDLNTGLNAKGETVKDDLHFTVEGYRLLGQRFAEKAIELVKRQSAPLN